MSPNIQVLGHAGQGNCSKLFVTDQADLKSLYEFDAPLLVTFVVYLLLILFLGIELIARPMILGTISLEGGNWVRWLQRSVWAPLT